MFNAMSDSRWGIVKSSKDLMSKIHRERKMQRHSARWCISPTNYRCKYHKVSSFFWVMNYLAHAAPKLRSCAETQTRHASIRATSCWSRHPKGGNLNKCLLFVACYMSHRIRMYAIYGNIYRQYTPFVLAFIPYMDPTRWCPSSLAKLVYKSHN